MKDGQLQRPVVLSDPDEHRCLVNGPSELVDKDDGNEGGDGVENQVSHRQALARNVGADRAQDRSNRRADVGADGQGQRIFVGNLADGQRGDDQHQCGVAGLHHDGGQHADSGEEKKPPEAPDGKFGQVNRLFIGFEALLHVVDAQEQEA